MNIFYRPYFSALSLIHQTSNATRTSSTKSGLTSQEAREEPGI
ncbi:MAG: hypothetical protein ABSG45_09530 [Nitrososphaerales archaeon]